MPYALSNAPSVFQSFMNEVFREFLHRFVIVYIDDILIYSQNLAEHHHHVKQVLQKLRQHHLYLKLEKCEFHRSTVQFLGYVISQDGIQMDQGKVKAIKEWPLPQSVKDLQRFLGFANFYRRFIKNFNMLTLLSPPYSEVSPSPCPGVPMPTKHLNGSRKLSARPPSFVIQTPKLPSWWKWMPPPPESGPCCCSDVASLPASILALELRHRQPSTARHQISSGRVASLAGESTSPFHCYYRS